MKGNKSNKSDDDYDDDYDAGSPSKLSQILRMSNDLGITANA